MGKGSRLINGAIDIRVDKGLLHFGLGEWLRSDAGPAEFALVERFVIPVEEAYGLFEFLLAKVPSEDALPGRIDDVVSEPATSKCNIEAEENTVRRCVARSTSEDTSSRGHGY